MKSAFFLTSFLDAYIFSDFSFLVPEIFLFFSLSILFLFFVFVLLFRPASRFSPSLFRSFSLLVLFAVGLVTLQYLGACFFDFQGIFLNSLYKNDPFLLFFKFFTSFLLFSYILISSKFCTFDSRFFSFEFHLLLFLSLIGLVFLISANDLILFYLVLELQSFCFYILAAFYRLSPFSAEAGLKYFILGSVASSFLLFGASLLYGFTGATNFDTLGFLFSPTMPNVECFTFGFLFFLSGLLFKVGLAPFHMWIPDVYDGSPFPTMAFFSVVTKASPFVFLARFVYGPLFAFFTSLSSLILFVSLLSIFVGSFGALYQSRLKRFLAYTSIAHAGFILLGLFTNPLSFLFYLVVYGFTGVGFFSALFSVRRLNGSRIRHLEDFKFLFFSYPPVALLLSIHFLSMAGIPPFSGFFSKFYVLFYSVDVGLYVTVLVALFLSVVSSFYYLRLLRVLFFDRLPSQHSLFSVISYPALLLSFLLAAFSIFFVFSPDLFLFPLQYLLLFLSSSN